MQPLSFHPDPARLTLSQQRVLALSVVFQAAWLVQYQAVPDLSEQRLAFGSLDMQAATRELLSAIFRPVPQPLHSLAAYGRLEWHLPGLRAMQACLDPAALALPITQHPLWRQRQSHILRHAIGLIRVEHELYANKARQQKLQAQLQDMQRKIQFFDGDILHRSVVAGLAQTYLETAGQLRRRIRVQGQMQRLTQAEHIDLIRAQLLGGIFAAHLWREQGGRRLQLIFGRKQLLQDLASLITLAQARLA